MLPGEEARRAEAFRYTAGEQQPIEAEHQSAPLPSPVALLCAELLKGSSFGGTTSSVFILSAF